MEEQDNRFDKYSTVSVQVLNAIAYQQHLITVNEIFDIIKQFNPGFNKYIETSLTELKKSKVIRTYKPTNSNRVVFYGLYDWFSDENIPQQQYIKP